jgi:isoaspartyl peptidase/L-asparaginase-like protein (Ntn-hydrolase superfamily)
VRFFEDCDLFNAGKGSVFTRDGTHEMDASIMNGSTLQCGAVSAVKSVKNPISLARSVMTNTEHVHLTGEGAEKFASGIYANGVSSPIESTIRSPNTISCVLEILLEIVLYVLG